MDFGKECRPRSVASENSAPDSGFTLFTSLSFSFGPITVGSLLFVRTLFGNLNAYEFITKVLGRV